MPISLLDDLPDHRDIGGARSSNARFIQSVVMNPSGDRFQEALHEQLD